ncbi:potassium voltage-gated channel subfamily A member 7-like [Liolophura sinensis]|uniref:potassium voltage-gated channel subfamily A member 7-like n=1 Tax=Liolophura sinensis TaxID=3198878 RepID=UPI0031591E5F
MHFASYNTERSFPNSFVKADIFTDQLESSEHLNLNVSNRKLRYLDRLDSCDAGALQAFPLLNKSNEVQTEFFKEGLEYHDCRGCKRVVINVSGMRFETQVKTLDRLPNTLLGNPEKRKAFWDPTRGEYFLDRHRPTFQAVLYFYQSGGKLKRPIEVPSDIFFSELEFYELGAAVIESYKRNEGYMIEKKLPLPETKLKRALWLVFEEPSSSWFAVFIMALSTAAILASLVGFCMETLPEYSKNTCSYENKHEVIHILLGNASGDEPHTDNSRRLTPSNGIDVSPRPNTPAQGSSVGWLTQKKPPNYGDPFFIVEAVCVSWFSIEFLARLYACPSKCKFLKSMSNIVDIVAIMPFFVTLLIGVATGNCVDTSRSGFLLIVRVVKVLRIFKLGKHSQGLQILAKTLKASFSELSLFAMFLCIALVLFSSAMYFAEFEGNPSYFPSIPHAFWYTIVTMTTVGYGDAVPIGPAGKVIGSLCVLAGVLVIALPVPVVVANFSTYYLHATGRGVLTSR